MGTEIASRGVIAPGGFWLGGALLELPIVSDERFIRSVI